jgi:hypothetical protein
MPAEPPEDRKSADASALYGAAYYTSHCGSIPYDRSEEHWGRFFGNVADELIRIFRPSRVFDAGCAHGFLVEALWDRGVEAWGRDISEFAISNVRTDIRHYCKAGSLTEKIEGRYDLVVSIEVLEHMTEADGKQAIANMTAVADRIVFSSSPDDFTEPTHINVKPAIYWMRLFAANGFAPLPTVTVPSITPYALAFERSDAGRDERHLLACAELVHQRLELAHLGRRIAERERVIAELRRELDHERNRTTSSQVAALRSQVMSLQGAHQAVLASTSWRMTAPFRAAANRLPPQVGPRSRRGSRQAMKLLWWCATLQIIDRIKDRYRAQGSSSDPAPSAGIASDNYAATRATLITERSARYADPEPGLISLVTPAWNTDPAYLDALAQSVFAQDCGPGFEWIILDNGSQRFDTRAALTAIAAHPAVRLERVEQNIGIIGALARCLAEARNRYIVPLDSDDLLTRDCLRVLTTSLRQAGYPALAYTDEDKIEDERLRDPYFKPDWDPVLFVHSCYIAHLCAIDRRLAIGLGCYSDAGVQGSHDWDSFTRFYRAGYAPHHVPEVVYSWRMHPESTAKNIDSKNYIFDSQRRVIERFIASSAHAEAYGVLPSPLFGGTPDWRPVPRAPLHAAITTVMVGVGHAEVPTHPAPADHRVVHLADPADLKGLLALVESCAADGRLVHLLATDVTISDASWAAEAQALFDLFPDTVMVGGRIVTDKVIVAADGYFGFGYGWDSPNRGRVLEDRGYFAQAWKPHSANVVPLQHCVLRADFLAAALARLIGTTLDLGSLAPWLGAAAATTGTRVIYSPFLFALSWAGMPRSPEPAARAAFLNTYGMLVPDRRLLSPHLGLTPDTAFRPLPAAERNAQEVALAAL